MCCSFYSKRKVEIYAEKSIDKLAPNDKVFKFNLESLNLSMQNTKYSKRKQN